MRKERQELKQIMEENNIKSFSLEVNKECIEIRYMSYNFYDEDTFNKIFKSKLFLEKLKKVYNNVEELELDNECYTATYLIHRQPIEGE